MKEYLKIEISPLSTEQIDIMIAFLSDLDFYAFETGLHVLYAFIEKADFNKEELELLLPETAAYKTMIIPDRNWNEEWEKNFNPVIVGDFVAVRASFHPPVSRVTYDIIITPRMSFGTGHHATTYMMIEWMEMLDFEGKSVVDFGTGSGVLAILAEKLGAATVLALDNDDWSILNAKENIAENGCIHTHVLQADSVTGDTCFDIVMANINMNVLMANASLLSEKTKTDSEILLSGFLEEDAVALRETYEQAGFTLVNKRSRNNWVSFHLRKI